LLLEVLFVACSDKRDLASKVDSAAHHLEMALRKEEDDFSDIRRIAQGLIDALRKLREHEDKHGCNV
jgi:hypothetical protein